MRNDQPSFCAIFIAVLWKADLRLLVENKDLVYLFHQAFEKFGGYDGYWIEFRRNPHYLDCRNLHDAIALLTLGGGIVRDGLTDRIRPQASVLGGFGQKNYMSLPRLLQNQVNEVAAELAVKFGEV